MEPLSYQYIAGFFDGEGSITIHHSDLYPPSSIMVRIGQIDDSVLRTIQTMFGGRIDYDKIAHYQITGYSAVRFLSAILPYLHIKHNEAELAILYQRQINSKQHRTPLDDFQLAERWSFYEALYEVRYE